MHVRAKVEDGWQIERIVLQMLQRRLQAFLLCCQMIWKTY